MVTIVQPAADQGIGNQNGSTPLDLSEVSKLCETSFAEILNIFGKAESQNRTTPPNSTLTQLVEVAFREY